MNMKLAQLNYDNQHPEDSGDILDTEVGQRWLEEKATEVVYGSDHFGVKSSDIESHIKNMISANGRVRDLLVEHILELKNDDLIRIFGKSVYGLDNPLADSAYEKILYGSQRYLAAKQCMEDTSDE